jgi:hypothetical protein
MKCEINVHRYLISILAVITLLSQWGLVDHAYHNHEHDESCVVYLTANANGHAITPSLPALPIAATSNINEQLPQLILSTRVVRYYTSRAPPRFL